LGVYWGFIGGKIDFLRVYWDWIKCSMELILQVSGEGPKIINLDEIQNVNGSPFNYDNGLPYPPYVINMTNGNRFLVV
jgi:hypothetical protein